MQQLNIQVALLIGECMGTKILDFKGPIEDDIISDFENEIGIKIPKEYRDFLKEYNGGYPQPDGFSFGEQGDGSSVDRFLSLGCEKNHDLHKYFNIYKDRIPNGYLPIAHDPGGNLVLIKLSADKSMVYFWDHEDEADEGESPSMRNVYLISQSFHEFIDGLVEVDI